MKSLQLLLWSWGIPCITAVLNNSTIVGSTNCPGYEAHDVQIHGLTLIAKLILAGEPCNMFGKDIKELDLHVSYQQSRLQVKISDASKTAFEVPSNLLFPDKNYVASTSTYDLLEFNWEVKPFSFKVSRRDTKEVLFNTQNHPLIYEDQYLEISSSLPKDANIYGIGEVVGKFRRDPEKTTQAMWARDVADPTEENIYGSHPLYIELRKSQAHGVHLLNSYGMDVILANQSVGYKILGGVIDLSFFAGPTPRQVTNQYTATFGRPQQIPYWALGFQQCRWGYKTIDEVAQVVEKYAQAKIPLETMWSDIDYMDMYKDFTVDPINYPLDKVQKFVKTIHDRRQQYIVIIDPAIDRNETYKAYIDGKAQDVFIKNPDGSDYVGQVWPGFTLFPDWFAPNAQKWWTEQISDFLNQVPVDGIWIDMNEPASFCAGSCGSNRTGIPPQPWEDETYTPDVPQLFNEPSYAIHNHYGNLSAKTLSTDAVHYGGLTEFQVHNLYGHMEAIATRNALLTIQPEKRPFVLGRSTFTGSGAVEGHWTGDNFSSWDHLAKSIAGVLSLQLFGIPYTGADICGFGGDTTEELCLRWMQLGSMYPFSRNHNNLHKIPQEPYVWESVANASRQALHTRYQILPYFYTLFQHAHTNGSPVWNSLAFEFFNQPEYLNVDYQFLVGRGLLVSPVVEQGASQVNAKFPPGTWYDYYNHKPINGPTTATLPAPLDGPMPIHIRAGNVIPQQDPQSFNSIHDIRSLPFQLIVALGPNCQLARGDIYLDDGISVQVGQQYTHAHFVATPHNITSHGHFGYKLQNHINQITILGLTEAPTKISLQINQQSRSIQPRIESSSPHAYTLFQLDLPLGQPFTLSF